MSKTVTSSEAVRRFGDLLAEVRHTGENVIITKNGSPVAKLEPVRLKESMRVREFFSEWNRTREESPDKNFANDLEKVQATDRPAGNAWE